MNIDFTALNIDPNYYASWMPIAGVILPYIQTFLNRIITKDITVFGVLVKMAEQRFAITCLLSLLLGIISTVTQYGWGLTDLIQHSAEVFALSQLAFYAFFKHKEPDTPQA